MANRVRIVITSSDPLVLRDLITSQELDISCGGAKRLPSGEWTLEAYVAPDLAARLQQDRYRVQVDSAVDQRAAAQQAEVARGDRFEGGKVLHGVGRKE
jgi:hypothetical protein